MAPHATSPPRTNGVTITSNTTMSKSPERTGHPRTMLSETKQDELHDMICVGFGPASLAIAVALHDSIEFGQNGHGGRSRSLPKVAFLEKQFEFAWHPGMQLPGARMQISWIKDLATMRNPRSQFTFLNYLHSVGRLVSFSNLGTFTPLRIEYEAYLRWCADCFKHVTAYGQEGLEVVPQRLGKGESAKSEKVDHFLVRSKNLTTGEIEERRARHVVLATGGKGSIPAYLPQSNPRVIHSSTYANTIGKVLCEREKDYRVVIVGAGQSAAEIFHDLHSRYPNSRSRLMIRGAALKPSDDSPFVNETFNPEHVDNVFHKDPEVRRADILDEKVTNYGVVRISLLEEIYNDLYEQEVRHPGLSAEDRQHQILPYREVTAIDDVKGRLRVNIENRSAEHFKHADKAMIEDTFEADAVIIAAGYQREFHETVLTGARSLMPGGEAKGKRWTVGRDYAIKFEPDTVKADAGVWLQGCNEETHGLSDTLLSILSIRGGEIVDSIFGES